MREVNELINVEDPAWPLLLQELSGTDVSVEVLTGDGEIGRASLLQLQVSARSNLGGIALNCGGLLVDSGWLRIFGSPSGAGPEGLPSLAEINAIPATFDPAWRAGQGWWSRTMCWAESSPSTSASGPVPRAGTGRAGRTLAARPVAGQPQLHASTQALTGEPAGGRLRWFR
ncbi:DUF2625 family protein [Streptomyces sanglieri]|uniref:DUF2625 family protein n=1 Tax=Streptomyces sanglieri TaxID=193460 RepID=UPI0035237096